MRDLSKKKKQGKKKGNEGKQHSKKQRTPKGRVSDEGLGINSTDRSQKGRLKTQRGTLSEPKKAAGPASESKVRGTQK